MSAKLIAEDSIISWQERIWQRRVAEKEGHMEFMTFEYIKFTCGNLHVDIGTPLRLFAIATPEFPMSQATA